MTKKKVTAPLTYKPGKGRPKEHLAYLNKGEMKALRLLNGNNMERGPEGLPSFPPADAAGSSSKASSSKPSSTGARGPTGPSGQARSSPAGNKGGAPGSVSRSPSVGGGGGGGGARDSGQAASRSATSSRPSSTPPSGGGGRDSGQATARSDAARVQADTQKRAQNLIGDLGKRYNLPAYTPPTAQNYGPLRNSGSMTSLDKSYIDQARDFLNRNFYGDNREGLLRVNNIENAVYSAISGIPVPAGIGSKIGGAFSKIAPSIFRRAPPSADDIKYIKDVIDNASLYSSNKKINVPDFDSLPRYPNLAANREAVRLGKDPIYRAFEKYENIQGQIDDLARDAFGSVAAGRAALSSGLGVGTNSAYGIYSNLNPEREAPRSEKTDFGGDRTEKTDFGGNGMKAGGIVKGDRKKVTAPLTYDPGKGRPKEHLAYLNYQEMQALQRLNGEGPYKGPKGIPSFVLGSATTKGTAANRAMSSAAQSNKAPSTTRAPAASAAAAKASASKTSTVSSSAKAALSGSGNTSRGGSASVARISGGTAGSNAARAALTGSSTSSRGGAASTARISGGVTGGNARDAQVRQSLASADSSKASKTPALRQDQSKTINVGPMSTPVKIGVPSGQQQRIAPRPTATTPMATQGPSFRSPLDARISNRFAINDAKLRSGALGIEGVPSVSQIAAENARRLNAVKMAQQYAQYRSPPGSYPAAPQGVFGPRVGEGTGYLRMAETPGMITTGMPSAPSGMPGPRGNAEATLRAYEQEMRIANAKPITDRIPASKLYEDRIPSEPRLSAGRSAVVPTTPPLMAEDGVYKRPGRDPAVERALAEAGFDPSGRRLQDLIDPSIPGRLAQTRIPSRAPSVTGPWPGQSAIPPNPPVYTPPPQPIGGGWPGQSAIPPNPPVYSPGGIPSIPAPTGEESIAPALGGLQAIPDPISMGLLAPPKPRMRPANLRPAPPIPQPRPADLMDAYRGLSYPGADGTTEEDIGGVYGEGDGEGPLPYEAIPGSQLIRNPEEERILAIEEVPPLPPKLYTNPITDRIPYTPVPGTLVPSLVIGVPGTTTAYKMTEGIPSVPPLPREPSGLNTRYSVGGGQGIVALSPQTPQDTYRAGVVSSISSLTTPERNAVYGSPAPPVPKPTPRPVREVDSGADLEDTATGVPGDETPSTDYTDEGPAPVDESELATPDKPGEELTQEQEQKLKETLKRGGLGIRIGAGVLGAAGVPFAGLAGGYLSRQYQKNKIEQIKQYAAMTDAQKLAAEKRNPELVGWAHRLGIDSVNDYDFYQSWADKSGLRGTPSREGGGPGGIASLGSGSRDDDQTGVSPTPDTPSTPSGRRPDIYYMWDLGVNIPSPSDPNYTQYQTYLAERLAAQRAMGFV